MSTIKNFTMNQYNGVDYDTLYPKTTSQQALLNDSELASNLGLSGDNPTVNDALYNVGAAEVVVTAMNGHTITATKGSTTLTQTVSSGYQIAFKIASFGTWTFTDTSSATSATVTIDTLKQYSVSLLSLTLNSQTWSDISMFSEAGLASQVFSVGDTKTVTIDNLSYQVQIIGFNHDTKASGGTAGITFQFKWCYNTSYYMNSSNTNAGGWASSYMRQTVMPLLLNKLPSDLQSVIVPVNKLSSAGSQSTTINTTSDSLFLLSEIEIFGTKTYSVAGEGSQYAYYNAGNSRIKYKQNAQTTAVYWWERSPYASYSTGFCCVGTGGSAFYSSASNTYGVAPGFCV